MTDSTKIGIVFAGAMFLVLVQSRAKKREQEAQAAATQAGLQDILLKYQNPTRESLP